MHFCVVKILNLSIVTKNISLGFMIYKPIKITVLWLCCFMCVLLLSVRGNGLLFNFYLIWCKS
jgi:energy-converting hydrogenase Eha subunit E